MLTEKDAIEEVDIENEETIFNINEVLIQLFSATKHIAHEKNIELIYEMGPNTPRKLRGEPELLLQLLSKMLTFVFRNTDQKDIVLSLSSPQDFLYEEFISFHTKATNIEQEKLLGFLKTDLSEDIETLGAKVIIDDEHSSDIHLSIPFKNIELGFRRHYRLPDKNIVGKKVLLFSANIKTAQSLKKMFEYFLYEVDIKVDQRKKQNLSEYDLVIISDRILTEELKGVIRQSQESTPLKYIMLHEPNYLGEEEETDIEHFVKPVTQEKIFDLIISLFNAELDTEKIEVVLTEDI